MLVFMCNFWGQSQFSRMTLALKLRSLRTSHFAYRVITRSHGPFVEGLFGLMHSPLPAPAWSWGNVESPQTQQSWGCKGSWVRPWLPLLAPPLSGGEACAPGCRLPTLLSGGHVFISPSGHEVPCPDREAVATAHHFCGSDSGLSDPGLGHGFLAPEKTLAGQDPCVYLGWEQCVHSDAGKMLSLWLMF